MVKREFGRQRRAVLSAIGVWALFTAAPSKAQKIMSLIPPGTTPKTSPTPQRHPHPGLWVTEDGHIRHELLPNGR